jgi:Ca-activated chloride channel family protein
MGSFEFHSPLFLFLLLPYAAMTGVFLWKRIYGRGAVISISSESIINKRSSFRARTYRYLDILRFLAILLLIIAAARPGRGIHYSSVKSRGIDIMVALDVSGSMSADDFRPDRLTVAKKVLREFIAKRKSDRIGLVVYAGEAYLQCPLTLEHNMLNDIIDEIDFRTVEVRGTAIGDAIALSASRMMESKSESRIILLITDGRSNIGIIDPETASKSAAELGIKIYSVGIGKEGRMPIDEETLQEASKITGGRYYRARSSGVFWEKIKDIDRLEKSNVDLRVYHEFYGKSYIFIIAAVGLFFLEIFLRSAVYRKVP